MRSIILDKFSLITSPVMYRQGVFFILTLAAQWNVYANDMPEPGKVAITPPSTLKLAEAQRIEKQPIITVDDKINIEKENKQAWENFKPPQDVFDWIQLDSGEWLKGEIIILYGKDLEFDSEELDVLKFDIKDIKKIRGFGVKSVRLEGPITVYGNLVVTEQEVIITSGEYRQVFDRKKLIAIAPGEARESNYWSAKLSMGFNLTGGNTEQLDYSAIINIKRRTSANRFVADYLGNLASTKNIETVSNHRLSGYIDVFKTRNYYWRPIFAEYFNDKFQNINSRITLGTGVGYHLIDTVKTEWDVTAGIAYQTTQFISVEVGNDSNVSTPALSVSTTYDTELTKRMDFDLSYSFNIVNEESGSYIHHLIATVENELTSWLDFDISFVWDRIQNPTPTETGDVPKPDDYKVLFTLGMDY